MLPTSPLRKPSVPLRWGLLALLAAMLVQRLPRLGVELSFQPGDFALGLLHGLAIGLLLIGVWTTRRA